MIPMKYVFVLSIFVCHKLKISESSVNIALNKTSSQSTTWFSNPSSMAVDGYRDCDMGFTHTFENKQNAWWQVDLGDLYEIKTVQIYYRDRYLSRLNGYSVTIISSLKPLQKWQCFKDEDPNTLPSSSTLLHFCRHLGRYVNISLERLSNVTYKDYDGKGAVINLCEFEVYGCPKGYYGNGNCDLECSEGCVDTRCDPNNGTCSCLDGWDGYRCETHKCNDGYYGNTCTPCSKTCAKNICKKHNGHCHHGCLDSMYGDFCNKSCPAYCKNSKCDQRTGYCSEGCQSRSFLGRKCNVCVNGFYGKDCDTECPDYCKHRLCDVLDGSCLFGCKHTNMTGDKCDDSVCDEGLYGKDCDKDCPVNCKHCMCDRSDGSCLYGCKHSGMTGDKCEDTLVATEKQVVQVNSHIGYIIAGVVSLINIVFIAIILLLLFRKRRCQSRNKEFYPITLESTQIGREQHDVRNPEQQHPLEYETLELDNSDNINTESAKVYTGLHLTDANLS